MKNIELFNLVTGRLLAELYARFPVRVDLEPDRFLDDVREALDQESTDPGKFWVGLVTWLDEEGYVSGQGFSKGGKVHGLRLTEHGLRTLNAVPEAVVGSDNRTVGQVLTDAAQGAAEEGGKALISRLVGELFNLSVEVVGNM